MPRLFISFQFFLAFHYIFLISALRTSCKSEIFELTIKKDAVSIRLKLVCSLFNFRYATLVPSCAGSFSGEIKNLLQ